MQIEPLETRRLLALNLLGSGDVVDYGVSSLVPVETRSAIAANGRFSVAANLRNTHGSQVVLTRYDANGDPVGTPITIAEAIYPLGSVPQSWVSIADIAIDGNGDTVVLHFESDSQASDLIRVGMTVITTNDAMTGPVTVFENTPHNELRDAAVAVDRSGNIFVGYVTEDLPQAAQLRIATFDNRGVKRTPRFTPEYVTQGDVVFGFRNLEMVYNPHTGGVIYAMTFFKDNDVSSDSDIYWGVTSQTASLTRGQITDDSTFFPSLAIASNGTFTVGYQASSGIDDEINSFVQRYSADGVAAGTPIEVAPGSRATQVRLNSLARDGNGNLLATLTTNHLNTSRLYAQTLINNDADRTLPSTELASLSLTDTLGFSTTVDLGIDDSGAAMLSYTRRDADYEGVSIVRRFSPLFAAVDRGTLYMFGTPGIDDLTVEPSGDLLDAIGPQTLQFKQIWVSRVSMLGGDGDDELDNLTTLPSTLSGENGNDSLSGGESGDYLLGGSGNDRIAGNGGDDTIYGQDGADTLFGNANNDRLNGGGGVDSLLGGPGIDQGFIDQSDILSSLEQLSLV